MEPCCSWVVTDMGLTDIVLFLRGELMSPLLCILPNTATYQAVTCKEVKASCLLVPKLKLGPGVYSCPNRQSYRILFPTFVVQKAWILKVKIMIIKVRISLSIFLQSDDGVPWYMR